MSKKIETWLIQRLHKPLGKPNPFSFGGGYKNGGFSDNVANTLSKICGFDYMGSAEYEFGDVPKAFKNLMTSELIFGQTVYKDEYVFIITSKENFEGVKELVEGGMNVESKDGNYFYDSVNQIISGEDPYVVGWLGIGKTTPFIVTINQEMADRFKELFTEVQKQLKGQRENKS